MKTWRIWKQTSRWTSEKWCSLAAHPTADPTKIPISFISREFPQQAKNMPRQRLINIICSQYVAKSFSREVQLKLIALRNIRLIDLTNTFQWLVSYSSRILFLCSIVKIAYFLSYNTWILALFSNHKIFYDLVIKFLLLLWNRQMPAGGFSQ